MGWPVVYISGNQNAFTDFNADDGFTITPKPGGKISDAPDV